MKSQDIVFHLIRVTICLSSHFRCCLIICYLYLYSLFSHLIGVFHSYDSDQQYNERKPLRDPEKNHDNPELRHGGCKHELDCTHSNRIGERLLSYYAVLGRIPLIQDNLFQAILLVCMGKTIDRTETMSLSPQLRHWPFCHLTHTCTLHIDPCLNEKIICSCTLQVLFTDSSRHHIIFSYNLKCIYFNRRDNSSTLTTFLFPTWMVCR